MAIALVSAGTPALTAGPAFGQATASGNLLTGWLYSNNSSATFNDTLVGTGWTLAVSGGQAFNWASLWYKANCGASETAPTVTTGGSVYYARLAEYSGAATTSPVDSSGGNGGTGGSTEAATNAASDAAAGSLILFCGGWNGGNTGGTISVTMADSSGSSVTPTTASATNGTGFYLGAAYGVAGSTGASKDTATGTLSVFCNGAGCIASFKAAAAAAVAGRSLVIPQAVKRAAYY
jgi:hypothetical protein